jgi:hypothetical protein
MYVCEPCVTMTAAPAWKAASTVSYFIYNAKPQTASISSVPFAVGAVVAVDALLMQRALADLALDRLSSCVGGVPAQVSMDSTELGRNLCWRMSAVNWCMYSVRMPCYSVWKIQCGPHTARCKPVPHAHGWCLMHAVCVHTGWLAQQMQCRIGATDAVLQPDWPHAGA